ncbi:MAG: hypothetical protein ACRERD_01560, partial [Candidatus Binatia bacterium]
TVFTVAPIGSFGTGQSIRMLGFEQWPTRGSGRVEPREGSLALYWQPNDSIAVNYSVFVHFRSADGSIVAQADGVPVSGHYPTTAWQAGEIIQDIYPVPPADLAHVTHVAIGLYDPVTLERLPAFDDRGKRLPEDALLLPWRPPLTAEAPEAESLLSR